MYTRFDVQRTELVKYCGEPGREAERKCQNEDNTDEEGAAEEGAAEEGAAEEDVSRQSEGRQLEIFHDGLQLLYRIQKCIKGMQHSPRDDHAAAMHCFILYNASTREVVPYFYKVGHSTLHATHCSRGYL